MKRTRKERPAHRASIVHYSWCAVDEKLVATPHEVEIDNRLKSLRAEGFVEDYDTGRGYQVWFTCPAGKRARALRDWVKARLPECWTNGRANPMAGPCGL